MNVTSYTRLYQLHKLLAVNRECSQNPYHNYQHSKQIKRGLRQKSFFFYKKTEHVSKRLLAGRPVPLSVVASLSYTTTKDVTESRETVFKIKSMCVATRDEIYFICFQSAVIISPSRSETMALEAPITKKRRLAGGTEGGVCKGETNLKEKEKRNVSVCVGCGSHIADQYIMQVSPDLCWHASCLKCADCEQYLDESCTCFVRDGKTYCKRDYVRSVIGQSYCKRDYVRSMVGQSNCGRVCQVSGWLFGTKCSRCGLGFCREDVVMRPTKGTVFHLNCFRCIVCNKPLVTGDEFAIREDGLFCRADHDVIDRSVTASPCQDICSPGSAYGGTNNNNSGLCNNNNNNNQNSHNNNNNNNNNTSGGVGKETENKKSGEYTRDSLY
ncbi:Insulin protein enhancer protein isl-1 [Bulinus truncatus]|nr:Insulin protein enhancer protein isl-1 [Bulinus truncatus]